MKRKVVIWIIFVGIIVGGISYWFNAYNEGEVNGISIYVLMGSGAFLGSFILDLLLNEKSSKIALLVWAGALLSIFGRIVVDGIRDSSTHNLFPFELIFASFIIVPFAFIGAYFSQLIKYYKRN
jgi:hypothetical protein